MNDEELDRELKRVQLMREKLALEKELKRKELKEKALRTAGRAPSIAVAASASVFSAVAKFLRRWWKAGLIGGVVLVSLAGGFAIYSNWKEKKEEAEKAEYWAQARPYIDKICKPHYCSGEFGYREVCHQQYMNFDGCYTQASDDFEAFWKAQKAGTFPPAPALKNVTSAGLESVSSSSNQQDGADLTTFYAIETAAFSDLESARLWRTRVELLPSFRPFNNNVLIAEKKAGWTLLISEFHEKEEAEKMIEKLADAGIEAGMAERSVDFQFVR